ncbi:MAG: hypothetical protein RL603_1784 [Pseudomonadota bacterium]
MLQSAPLCVRCRRLNQPAVRKFCAGIALVAIAGAGLMASPTASAETVSGGDFASAEAAAFVGDQWAAPSVAERLIDKAMGLLGTPYRYGGRRRESGLDCSGLLHVVFLETLGVSLPRSAAEIGKLGEPVATEELRPGDLVFFNTLGRSLSHVGIYIGNNEFIHAGSRGTPRAVRINRLDQNYFSKRFEGARRLLP